MLSFSKNFLSILKIPPGLLECYVFVLVFHILVILQKVLERFLHSSSHLIMTQIFILFDCLRPRWCKFYCKFSVTGPNSALNFPVKFLVSI